MSPPIRRASAWRSSAAQRLPGGNTRTTVHFSPFPLYMASRQGQQADRCRRPRLCRLHQRIHRRRVRPLQSGDRRSRAPSADRRHQSRRADQARAAAGRRSAAPLSGDGAAALLQFGDRGEPAGARHRARGHRQARRHDLRWRLSRLHPLFLARRIAAQHEVRVDHLDLQRSREGQGRHRAPTRRSWRR